MSNAKISELTPDPKNANKGTQRGLKALDKSLRQYGAGRSILLDRDNRIIAGNKTAERALDVGLDDVIIVETDGTKLVAVKRTDLDLEDDGGKARALATYDNRVGQLDLDWDLEALHDLAQEVLEDLGLDGFLEPINYDEAWQGMPEFEQEEIKVFKTIKVHFKTENDYKEFAEIIGQNLTDKTISIYHPKQEDENLKKYKVQDEP